MKRWLTKLVVCLLLGGCSPSDSATSNKGASALDNTAASDVTDKNRALASITPLEIARIIAALPDLPLDVPNSRTSDLDLSAAEWRTIMRAAVVLQATPSEIIEDALRRYMDQSFQAAGVGIGKPILLLRVAFDIPQEDDERPSGGVGESVWIFLIGIPPDERRQLRLTDPVGWSDDGPRLTAFMASSFGITGGPMPKPYDPVTEYHYLRAQFAYRNGLEHWVGGDVVDWYDVLQRR